MKSNGPTIKREVFYNDKKFICRDLDQNDDKKLYYFLRSLSKKTISKSFVNCDLKNTAKSFCNDIGKYDKHRYVLLNNQDSIVALFEFSLDLPDGDIKRYQKYNDIPDINKICRWGLTIADDYQNIGIGTFTFPLMKEITKKLNKEYIILYGGVYLNNERAIHFYKKLGFIELGTFKDVNGIKSMDMIFKVE